MNAKESGTFLIGGDLEYADQVTMAKALEGRREI